MNALIERMTSEPFKVLRMLYENRETMADGTEYVPMSQVDLARKLNVSNMKMNSIFKQLDKDDLVHLMEGKRGKYLLTDKANTIIKEIGRIESKLEGAEK